MVIRKGLKKLPIDRARAGDSSIPISVIIAAKNEAANLQKNLGFIQNQNYQDFEIVLVNDNSSDETHSVMTDFAARDERIRVLSLDDSLSGKKEALKAGIDAANYERLVFTDADCQVEAEWLSGFADAFDRGGDFVIGYGAYRLNDSWFSSMYSFDAFRSAMLYFSAAANGLPYMCVGRSMGYTRSLFQNSEGFASYAHIESGSDDLFLQSVEDSAHIEMIPAAVSYSEPPTSFGRWLIQRKRHLGAGIHYPKSVLALLIIYEGSNILLPIILVLLLMSENQFLSLFSIAIILRVTLFYLNTQTFSRLVKSNDDLSQLWWTEYPMSWLNALISMNIGLKKKEAWTTRR